MPIKKHLFPFLFIPFCFLACTNQSGTSETAEKMAASTTNYPTTGSIERLDPALDAVIPPGAKLEVLASGFNWSEGPLWLPGSDILIFSDVPENIVYQWKEGETEASVYLNPSGYTGAVARAGEPGSNGLTLDTEGRLILCQHGDRRVARMDASLDQPTSTFISLVDQYNGQRFNSPNDLDFDSRGNLYFTDPPYGLEGGVDSPLKEIPFQGVYKLSPDGTTTLLTDTLTRPNGIALSPDEKTLYVAVSDPEKAWWVAYDVNAEGLLENGRILQDGTAMVGERKGLPDGLKVRSDGILFATGPGGVWVISPEGVHLGTILTGQATANCAFNPEEDALYMTADSLLMRVNLSAL